ncbi:CLUMA_CG001580, isoform A [Clunio marinus]|uniref:CLUMA_CG001580, isoform A n=1 Tax=Clunio marinus TaxID=568069 RepID=A0A1J1HIS1_9DIPT|nr:CLUMA_CG001580, isoform A [Clunio marinus]
MTRRILFCCSFPVDFISFLPPARDYTKRLKRWKQAITAKQNKKYVKLLQPEIFPFPLVDVYNKAF